MEDTIEGTYGYIRQHQTIYSAVWCTQEGIHLFTNVIRNADSY
jgi:hypothetical protein